MGGFHTIRTKRGYGLAEVASALQKTIRRGEARLAVYFAIELLESGYGEYVWKRLLTVSGEDCAGVITREIWAMYHAWVHVNKGVRQPRARFFVAKAAIMLALQPKSRDGDVGPNLYYDQADPQDPEIVEYLRGCEGEEKVPLPEYTFDVHTAEGRRRGKTRQQFFLDEERGLFPLEEREQTFADEVAALVREVEPHPRRRRPS
jgi:replication-associated recombination protein RarA